MFHKNTSYRADDHFSAHLLNSFYKRAAMDIDSINAGTVDSKSWLNPTVGTLRAKKIICDDITPPPIPPPTPGVPNLGWVRTAAANQPVTVTSGEFGYFWKDGTSSTPSGKCRSTNLASAQSGRYSTQGESRKIRPAPVACCLVLS